MVNSTGGKDTVADWTVQQSAELYSIDAWGQGHFSINGDGNLTLQTPSGSLDLKTLVDELSHRGLDTPILIRLLDLLEVRVEHLNGCFARAIEQFDYKGSYRGVYPIKVNQQRHVVEKLLDAGSQFGLGLEVGSKPELLAAVAVMDTPDAPIICNGFKDRRYVETALTARQLQENVVIVLDRPEELDLILSVAEELNLKPQIGVRFKLATIGSGRWWESGGERAKFGLTLSQVLDVVDRLRTAGSLDSLVLLHFHIGSQINDIAHVKQALKEAARVYAELASMGVPLQYLDVGGGLGVDYLGSRTKRSNSSLNYTTQEYADDVVYWVRDLCDELGVAHPTLITESGRSLVAHHALLVFDVLGTTERGKPIDVQAIPPDPPRVIEQLLEIQCEITKESLMEDYHDAQHLRREYLNLFRYGGLSLRWRSVAEQIFADICRQLLAMSHVWRELGDPAELENLKFDFADVYYGNFSLFQSLPDVWAIEQAFPIVPLHRLDERPTQDAILADLTCDSDGKIEHFVTRGELARTIPLHRLNGEPYLLATCMVGAYQEILGDLHNLFGDTNSVCLTVVSDGDYVVDDVVEGEVVGDVLSHVEYETADLLKRMRKRVDSAVRSGRLDIKQSRGFLKTYTEGLRGYTYLERDTEKPGEDNS